MTAATIEAPGLAAVVMTTADGESRPAELWGKDSYSCGFCDSPVFGPLDWNDHEAANAAHYEKRGETYTWEPYSYRARYWEARECANPGCVTALAGDHLAQYRKREADQRERDERKAREEALEQAKREAAEQATRAREAAMGELRGQAEQLGFAWACFHEQASGYGSNVACAARGNDRGEYTEHMRGHGARQYHGTKRIKLKRKAPAATMRKLEIPAAKWLHWDEDHREPGTCDCGHGYSAHRYHGQKDADGQVMDPGCTECPCEVNAWDIKPVITTATRRGQFWAEGTRPHTFWVLPFEAAPWETGQPAPVMLSVSRGGLELASVRVRFGGAFEFAGTGDGDVVRRAENVRRRGVFAIRTGEGSLRGYYRASAYIVHADPECASADGWRESDHQPYDTWAVVDRLTGRSQGDSDHTLCPRCVLLEQD